MSITRTIAIGFCLFALTACGGGDNSGPASSSAVTVTPALGKVQGAYVRLYSLQGTLLAQGHLGTDGSVPLATSASLANGFVVELVGGNGAYYFDEGIGGTRPLAAGQLLHAVSAGPRASITVSALTEIVFRRAFALANGGSITAAHIAQAETELRTLFGLGADESPLAVPELVDDPFDLPATATWPGRYASLLAGWASLALAHRQSEQPDCLTDSLCAPLPDLIASVADDFADGALDSLTGSTPLATPYADATGDQATYLGAALASAETGFRERVAAARENVPDTDRLIGDNLAGNYALSCSRTLPTPQAGNVPATVTIAADGSMSLQSTFARFRLAAGASFGYLSQEPATSHLFVARGGNVVPASLFDMSASPVADGLTITITPPADLDLDLTIVEPTEIPPAPAAVIMLSSSGNSRVWVDGTQWDCSTIAGRSDALVNTPARLAQWLPEGLYQCEENGDPSLPRYATISSGTLTVQTPGFITIGTTDYATLFQGTRQSTANLFNNSYSIPLAIPLASYAFVNESRDDPLGFHQLDSGGHSHSGDAVAATLYPRSSLLLATVAGGADSLRVYRSLVTGAGYFELDAGTLALRHCQVPASSAGGTTNGGTLYWPSYDGSDPVISEPDPDYTPPDGCYGAATFC